MATDGFLLRKNGIFREINAKHRVVRKNGTLVILAIFWLASCGDGSNSNSTPSRPNVLFIMIDDLNDNIGVLGGHRQALTPHLDEFARSAATFVNTHNYPMA